MAAAGRLGRRGIARREADDSATSDRHDALEDFDKSHASYPYSKGEPDSCCHADPGSPLPYSHDAQVAKMRAAAGIEEPAAADALILNVGTFETEFHDWHRDPYHGIDAHQAQVWAWPRPSPAQACGAPYRGVRGCGCAVKVVRDHCDRLECSQPYCEDKNRDRRARDIFDRLELARRGRPIIYTIFTVPPSRREDAANPKTWKRWLRNLLAYLKKDFDLEYAVERSDPAGEDGERWHPHVNLLWVRRSGRGFIPEEQLDAIKARWKKILGLKPEDPINIRTRYTKEEKHIRFWCRYLGRPWSRWAKGQKYLLRVKWFGRPPKVERDPGAKECPKCGRDVICLPLGSQEAAEQLAAKGYERLLEEYEDRKAHFRRMRPAKFQRYTARVGPGGTEWIPERRT